MAPYTVPEIALLTLGACSTILVAGAWLVHWIERLPEDPEPPPVVVKPPKPQKPRPRKEHPAMPAQEPPRPAAKAVQFLPGPLSHVRGLFHADQCISGALIERLRQHRLDVTTTAEAGLLNVSDAQQLAYARDNRRVLITHDKDFRRLAAEGKPHAGIIHAPSGKQWRQEIIRLCLRLSGEVAEA